MIHGFGRSLLVFSAAALLTAGTLSAQDDARHLFQEGVRLLMQNKDAEALEKLKAAVAADPSNEDAYKIWQETDNRVWSAMMVKNDELAKVARHMLRLAKLQRKQLSSDADKIRELVGKALSDSYEERSMAALELMQNHGDYAVPYLLEALGNPDEETKQSYAILAAHQLGRAGTLPLVAALASDNAILRRNIAAALLYTADDRALPALKRLAERDDDASVREVAQKAVVKIGGAGIGPATSLYLAHSHDYLTGGRLIDGDILDGVWSFEDGKLEHRKVPAVVFPLELAKDAAYGALQVDPNSEDALVALSRAYVAEKAVVDAAGSGDESIVGLKDAVNEMGITVLAAGPGVLRKAFDQNVAEGMIPAAVASLEALARLENPRDLGASPLLKGLRDPDKRIRYGAAIALAGMNAELGEADRAALVSALGQAVLEQSVRIVKYVDPSRENGKVAEAASDSGKGIVVISDASAKRALADITRYPPDVLVLNEDLEGMLVDTALLYIGDRPALAEMKRILVSKDPAGAQEIFGEKFHGYIKAPVTALALANRVDDVLKGASMDRQRAEADRVAANAAEAMAMLDPAAYPVAEASAQLVTAAGRVQEKVAVSSLAALGGAAAPGVLAGVVKVMNDSRNNPPVCAAAASALGRIMARSGTADKDTVDALVAVAADKSLDAAIRRAAVAALGQAPILPGTRAKLLRTLRVDPKAGDEGE